MICHYPLQLSGIHKFRITCVDYTLKGVFHRETGKHIRSGIIRRLAVNFYVNTIRAGTAHGWRLDRGAKQRSPKRYVMTPLMLHNNIS